MWNLSASILTTVDCILFGQKSCQKSPSRPNPSEHFFLRCSQLLVSDIILRPSRTSMESSLAIFLTILRSCLLLALSLSSNVRMVTIWMKLFLWNSVNFTAQLICKCLQVTDNTIKLFNIMNYWIVCSMLRVINRFCCGFYRTLSSGFTELCPPTKSREQLP